MPFKGRANSLEELFDVLQILESQKKEGILKVDQPSENVIITIKNGNFEKISTNIKKLRKLKNKEKLPDTWKSYFHFINIFWNNYPFEFQEVDINYQKNNIPISSFLLEFSTEKDEIQEIVKKLISNPIKLAPKGELKEENFSSLDLWLYGEIIKNSPIEEILFSNIPLKGILKSLNKLFKAGLIEVKIEEKNKNLTKEERKITKEKIEQFEQFLAKIVGPVADLLILEALEELNCHNHELAENLASAFIAIILEKIPDDCLHQGLTCNEILLKKFNEIVNT